VLAWTRGQDFLTDGSMIEEQMPTLVRFTPIECAAGREFNPHGLCFFLSWLLCAAFFFLGAVGSERPVLTKRSASAPGIEQSVPRGKNVKNLLVAVELLHV
jgi:hypothetical protein